MFRFRNAEDQTLVGRDVFVIALFAQAPFPAVLPFAEAAFDAWLKVLPKGVLEWSVLGVNASSHKRFTPAAIARARAELDPAKVAAKGSSYFWLCGGEDPHNPSYAFTFKGSTPGGKVPDQTSYVEVRWPSEFPESHGFDATVEFVRKLGEAFPYRSGYASPALSRGWEDMAHVTEGAQHITPLALHHPGYDLPENLATAAFMAKDRCRGARWLTLLGPELVKALGGRDALAAKLAPGVSVLPAGDGLLVRAGERPEIGDVNRAVFTPLLRSVAAAIEPVTYFNDWKSLGQLFADDQDRVLRWERRHLD
jgi:Protein of unknown function (DUF3396)